MSARPASSSLPAEATGHADTRARSAAGRRASWLRVRSLIAKELRQLFRDPRTSRVIFVSPVIQLLIFGYAVTTDVRSVPAFLVDLDRTQESRALIHAITAGGWFRIVATSDRPADIIRALDQGSAAVGVEIPRGFSQDLAAGRATDVQILIDGTNSNTATVAQGYITRIVQSFALQYLPDDVRAGQGIDLRARAWYNPGLTSRVYNVPAVIGALLFLMSLLLTALAVVRERELGTLDQLMVSPITAGELILGKTIPVTLIAFVDLALIAAVAILWFDVPFRGGVFALVLASFLFILVSLGIGLLISTVSRTQQEAFMAMFLVLLPALILSGFLYPVHTMPAFFQALTMLNPVRWFLEIVRALFLKGSALADLWPQYLILAAMATAILLLATFRFRRTLA
ncbi:MAG: ABC transporter permease [Gemmatimonadetes bacterium]|nr:ABC transporter permease [Gemmatimonadota bacterium]